MQMVWHYTVAAKLEAISATGALIGGNAGAPDEERVLWFSANQKWEPTSTKMKRTPDGRFVPLTFEEMAKSVGCVRFGLDAADMRLLNWTDACEAAGTPRSTRRSMEQIGKKRGQTRLIGSAPRGISH